MAKVARIRGRDDVLARIDALLASVGGGPVAIILEGTAGIGKTALWNASVQRAESRGMRILSTRPVRAEARLGFAGLGDLFADVDATTLDSIPTVQREALEAALLRTRREVVDRRAVAVAVAGLLEALAATQPVLVAIDDVQWLDAATRRMLEFAVRRLDRSASVAFLSAQRLDTEPTRSANNSLRSLLEQLRHDRVSLGPLPVEHLTRVLIDDPEIDLPRATLNQIVHASGGNPLYALELARGLQPQLPLRQGEPLPIPDSLRAVVRQRLEGIDSTVRGALLLLALLARPRRELVNRVLDRVGASVDSLCATGLVEDSTEDVQFTHPLLASVVLRDATIDDRRAAHRIVADVVDDVEERARHLALGTRGEDKAVVAELESAAVLARARGAPETAAELLDLAMPLVPSDRAEDRRRLAFSTAEYLFNAGENARARGLLEVLLEDVDAGPQRARVLELLASVRHTSDSATDALRLIRQALEEAAGDVAVRLPLEFTAALILSTIGDYKSAHDHLDEARRVGAELSIEDAVNAAQLFELALRNPLELDEEIWARVDLTPLPGGVAFARASRMLWEGNLDDARVILEDLRTDALVSGDDDVLPMVLQYLVRADTWSGHFDRAQAHGAAALAITEFSERDVLRAIVLSVVYHARAAQDPSSALREAIADGIALAQRTGAGSVIPEMRWAQGVFELSEGNVEDAATALADGRERLTSMDIDHPAGLRFLVDEVDALVACGRLDDANELLGLFPVAGRAAEVPWIRAAHARARGIVAARGADAELAMAELAHALEALRSTPLRYEYARTLLTDGSIRRRAKQWGSARRSLSEALALFEEMGAPRWAEQARSELSRVGGRQPLGEELSTTERRVADLVATGRTNKEVAAEMYLSQHTVEWHLRRIYRKLAVRNRAELAATLARQEPK